jgi:hypothetical protein
MTGSSQINELAPPRPARGSLPAGSRCLLVLAVPCPHFVDDCGFQTRDLADLTWPPASIVNHSKLDGSWRSLRAPLRQADLGQLVTNRPHRGASCPRQGGTSQKSQQCPEQLTTVEELHRAFPPSSSAESAQAGESPSPGSNSKSTLQRPLLHSGTLAHHEV